MLSGVESERSFRRRLQCVRLARSVGLAPHVVCGTVRAVNGDVIASPQPTFPEFYCPFQPGFPVVPLVEGSHSPSPSWAGFSSFSGVRSVRITRTNVREQFRAEAYRLADRWPRCGFNWTSLLSRTRNDTAASNVYIFASTTKENVAAVTAL
jgi:hypothetical protein